MGAGARGRWAAWAVAAAALLGSGGAAAQEMTVYSIGTADLDGGYWRVAEALCRLANEATGPRARCSPETTPGSIYNLLALRQGQLDLAIVQSDWQRAAWEGRPPLDAPMTELRSVLSLHEEQATLLARGGAGIAGFGDLRGRRLDLGPPASGRRATLAQLMAAFGIGAEDLAGTVELATASSLDQLCAGSIDAALLVVGHPSAAVARVLAECDVALVPVAGPELAGLLERGDLAASRVPAAAYGLAGPDRPTVAVRATVVARADADPVVVGAFVRAALRGLPRLRREEPLLAGLGPDAMRDAGLTAPLHPAAAAAFAGERSAD
ncbi:TAXI family TRAP transporter solute-binding subunit [Rubellimicrobium aerolatum]|uniref:TAXI family TRAP transporter solute-binding subunit n=1 Tax=Rubellimicrobium aerolatum TaxID=490979 RepID=A0ABW0S8W4_9RHOB|nr:TRAP transporter TAXI family solute receptor [Rubellimicrobium aerolatum]